MSPQECAMQPFWGSLLSPKGLVLRRYEPWFLGS